MAAVGTERFNMIEWSQFLHKGKVLPQVAMLTQENQMVMDIPWMRCNDGTTHLYSVTTKLPTVHKTAFNEGTPKSKSAKAQEREITTMLTGLSQIDATLAPIGGQEGALRAKEDMNFVESMRQTFAQMLPYGNRAADRKDINGFCTRYSSLSGVKSKNVISAGGTTNGTLCSILLVNWGADVYGVFPEGTTAGYQKQNLPLQTVTLPNGNEMLAKQTHHMWHVGLVVEDWRSVGRICNIKVADALALTNNQAPTSFQNILHLMTRLKARMRKPGKKVFYAPEVIHTLLMRLGLEKSNQAVTVEKAVTQFGEFQELRYLGIPVRLADQMVETEDQVL